MKQILFLALFTFCHPLHSISQTSGWERIYVKNVGYIDMPETMEVQSGKYKIIIDETKKTYGYDETQLTIQQKGLNEFGKNSFQKYARIMIETIIAKKGEFETLDFNLNKYSASDIAAINNTYKQQVIQSFTGTELKLTEWFPAMVEKINGYSAIHIRYKRQFGDKPIVMVNIYIFMNNDRKYTLTLSYRMSEKSYWQTDLNQALNSFRITNKR